MMELVATGKLRPSDAAAQVSDFQVIQPGEESAAMVDSFRADRTGFPEVIWGANKTPLQLVTIMRKLIESEDKAVATRVDAQVAEEVQAMLPGQLHYYETARMLVLQGAGKRKQQRLAGAVAVLTAGTGDSAVAEECRRTAELMGCYVFRLQDVGIDNGLHRVVQNLQAVRAADVVVVVSGMDGSLPSVIAGLVDSPVIAVPTSVGYGAALSGISPLLSALTAGAPGVATVNIDNGFGAAMLAARILRTSAKIRAKMEASAAAAAATL